MIIVVDASVAIKWFVDEGDKVAANKIALLEKKLIAPDIIFAEVANVLRRKIRSGLATRDQAIDAIAVLRLTFEMPVSCRTLMDDAFRLSTGLDHSIYDAIYLALTLGTPEAVLVTADTKFAAKAAFAGYGDRVLTLADAGARFPTGQEN